MRIYIIAVGERMPEWVAQGYQEYIKRLGPELPVELVEIPAGKRGKNAAINRILEREAKNIQAKIPANSVVVALDVKGKTWSTEELSAHIADWQQQGSNICFLIGGPEGLTPELIEDADIRLSLSRMTFPHPLVRAILAEQLYRAYSILKNHPYHK